MGVFDRWMLRLSARRFAHRLPTYIQRSWGESDAYTEAQIAAALRRCGLGGRDVAIAYAAYLSEKDYLAMAERLPRVLPYDQARGLFEAARPCADQDFDPPEADANMRAAITYGLAGGDPPP